MKIKFRISYYVLSISDPIVCRFNNCGNKLYLKCLKDILKLSKRPEVRFARVGHHCCGRLIHACIHSQNRY